jgi:NSS family neurotransmitter:Na+ symporter
VTIELTLGKISKGGPITACEYAGIPGGKYLGLVPLIILFFIGTYFMVVVGWFIKYFLLSFTDAFQTADLPQYFMGFAFADPQRFLFHGIVIVVTAAIVIFGVTRGLERACRIMVPILFICLIIMAIRSLTLPGAMKGVSFLFKPDWSKFNFQVVLMALGQIFFTLGISTSVIVLYGSYMKENEDIPMNVIVTSAGNTVASLIAALAIFPALFAFGIAEPASGPALVFMMFPAVLKELPKVFGIVFFASVVAAVLTSTIGIFEFVVEPLVYRVKMSRKKAVIIVALLFWVVGLPAAYNFNWLTKIDQYFSTIFLPLMGIIAPVALFVYIGREKALEWVNKGASFSLGNWWVAWGKSVYPILVAAVVVVGILQLLKVF